MPKSAISPKVSVADDFRSEARGHANEILQAFGERMDAIMDTVDRRHAALRDETLAAINEAVPRRKVVMPSDRVVGFGHRR